MTSVSRSTLWTVTASVVLASLQVAQMMVAARYLTPADFGGLAVVLSVMYIVLALQEMGLATYVIHLGDLSRRGHSTLFWTTAMFGATGATVLTASSGPISTFYGVPGAWGLFMVAALNALVAAIALHYQANLVRTFRAHHLGQIEVIARSLSFLLTCWLLIAERAGADAILIGLLAYSAGKAGLMAAIADRHTHPSFDFDTALARRAVSYGAWQSGSTFLNQLRYQADQLIVAKFFGPEVVGFYYLAKELVSYPLRFLEPLILRLTMPAFADVQTDATALNALFVNSVRRVSVLGGLIYGGVAFLAPWLIEILFGTEYLAALPLVLALITWSLARYASLVVGALALATGRTAEVLRWSASGAFASGLVFTALIWAGPPSLIFAVAASLIQVGVALAGPLFFAPPLEANSLRSFARMLILGAIIALAGVGLALVVELPRLAFLQEAVRPLMSSIL